MDTEKLAQEWKTDPRLKHAAYDTVEQLAEKLLEVHRFLLSPDGGLAGYLYEKQTKRAREVRNESK